MFDTIKDILVNQFAGPVSVGMIILSLLASFACALIIIFVYRRTFAGIVYNRTMLLTILLLAMTTAIIIRTINSNLALSLGMVGALSIVRFRTAVKEPVDTAFLFWAITAGIMSGAGLYVVALAGSVGLGLLYYLAYTTISKPASKYLLVVIFNVSAQQSVSDQLDQLKNKKLKSRSVGANGTCELTYEVSYDRNVEQLMSDLQKTEGVRNVNLVTYTNEFGQ